MGDPYPVYKELRATKPVCWNSAAKFWALLKYEDIRFVSTNPVFSSAQGITIPDPERPSLVQEGNLIFTDPPRHRQLRKLISAGFTRRQVSGLESKIRELVSGILDKIEPGATHEFVEEISAPLPTKVIADMLGAPGKIGSSSTLGPTRSRHRPPILGSTSTRSSRRASFSSTSPS